MVNKLRLWLSFSLCMAMLLVVGGGWAAPAQAAGLATASLPDVTMAVGSQANIALTLNADGASVVAIDLRLTWDPQVVRVDAATAGALAQGWAMSSNLSVPGELRVAMAGVQAISGSGSLLNLSLTAVGAEGTFTTLSVAQCALNDGAVACTPDHGQVAVGVQPLTRRVQLPLVLGWNMIALPITPSSTRITDVLASIQGQYDLVMAYDPQSLANPWLVYDPQRPAYANDLEELHGGQGFWVKANAAATLQVEGALAQGDLAMVPGWNLVGYRGVTTASLVNAMSSLAGQYDAVYTFKAAETLSPWKVYAPAAEAPLNDLNELEPGQGYWILMNQAGTWQTGS